MADEETGSLLNCKMLAFGAVWMVASYVHQGTMLRHLLADSRVATACRRRKATGITYAATIFEDVLAGAAHGRPVQLAAVRKRDDEEELRSAQRAVSCCVSVSVFTSCPKYSGDVRADVLRSIRRM